MHIIIGNVSFQNKSLGVGRCHEVSLLTVQKSALFSRPLAHLKCDEKDSSDTIIQAHIFVRARDASILICTPDQSFSSIRSNEEILKRKRKEHRIGWPASVSEKWILQRHLRGSEKDNCLSSGIGWGSEPLLSLLKT